MIAERLRVIRRDETHKHQKTAGVLAAGKASAARKRLEEGFVLQDVQKGRRLKVQSLQKSWFRTGLLGLWDRFVGQHRKIERAIKLETARPSEREDRERSTLQTAYDKQVKALHTPG